MRQQIEQLLQRPDFAEGEAWRVRRFPANAEILRQGDNSRHVYWIRKGTVRVLGQVPVSEARQVRPGVCDLQSGEVFGELALFDDQPRSATVMAVDECELVEIDGEALLDYLERHTELGFAFLRQMMTVMVQRLRASDRQIFSLLAWGMRAHGIDQHL